MTSVTALPRSARINDIDLSISRAAITDVDTSGALIYAEGITVHLGHAVMVELVEQYESWERGDTA